MVFVFFHWGLGFVHFPQQCYLLFVVKPCKPDLKNSSMKCNISTYYEIKQLRFVTETILKEFRRLCSLTPGIVQSSKNIYNRRALNMKSPWIPFKTGGNTHTLLVCKTRNSWKSFIIQTGQVYMFQVKTKVWLQG